MNDILKGVIGLLLTMDFATVVVVDLKSMCTSSSAAGEIPHRQQESAPVYYGLIH